MIEDWLTSGIVESLALWVIVCVLVGVIVVGLGRPRAKR